MTNAIIETNVIEAGAPVTRMDELVLEISQALENIQSESVKVGMLLTEANSEFKEQGKKASDFLQWAFDNFSIRKAQAYKLMTVAEHFGTDDRFGGVSMRVLYALATQANEDELEKAAELAANGSLTTTTLNLLLNPEPLKPVQPPIDSNKKAGETSLEQLPSAPETAPSGVLQASPTPEGGELAPQNIQPPAADNEEVITLRKQVDDLLAQLKALTDAQVQHNKHSAPSLPQFKHKLPHVVLGMSEDDAKSATKIKAAFRDLIKCGYGNGHEAFEKLVAAKDALLAE
ncbi:hypothetical protein HOS47_gp05 [Pseudomonas phage uligo]|uniref:Uncharacterized protein n=1 Tax=Pseudomonas phage uligo TaxID=2048979 RepID=A0A2H4P834_9CAUD|nr:hypothetical protein HOS47_gp05 [Pseudomonas phage uligo]ATW58210.1 hypothetical protein [Pseudomonas phage uligo]